MNRLARPRLTRCVQPLALVAAFALVACSETPQQTADDVAAAQRERARAVADAEHKLQKTTAETDAELQKAMADADHQLTRAVLDEDANLDEVAEVASEGHEKVSEVRDEAVDATARAAYDLAMADAEGKLKIADELCDGVPAGAERDGCREQARLAYQAAVRNAESALRRSS